MDATPLGSTAAAGLLEREDDLAGVDRAVDAARVGDGGVLLVEGPPGIGKTSLLVELRRRARRHGMTVLTARAGEIESGFGFGVVRQLLEGAVAGATADDGLFSGAAGLARGVFDAAVLADRGPGDPTYATLHGLYWVVANLAERSPLVLEVDDVHWADEPSVRFLTHLAPRLAGMPVLLAVAARSGAERRPELRPLLLEPTASVRRPRPLRIGSVRHLVETALGGAAAETLATACHDATGGNPFLLSELLGELRREARPAERIEPDVIRHLGPERIAAAMLLRVGQLGPAAPVLARAVAVLGEQAQVNRCAELAGLDPRRARDLADELTALAVLDRGEPLRFVHPIVRTAIYDDIPAGARSRLHAAAARLLAGHGADREQVAAHLMATDPAGDRSVVAALRAAAAQAMAGGAPDTAVALLQRALAEPAEPPESAEVLFELGSAEHALGSLAARTHLRAAADTARDPVLRARALVTLAVDTQADPQRQRDQLAGYEQAAREVAGHDRELASLLRAVRLGGLLFNPDLPVRFEDEAAAYRDLPGDGPGECLLLSFAARRELAVGGHLDRVAELAERAAADPGILHHPVNFWRLNTTVCLIAAERYDLAEQILTRALRRAEAVGSPFALSGVAWLRGLVRHARGDLRAAEADGRAALDSMAPNTMVRAASWCVPLLWALVDSGRVAEAEAVLAQFGLDADLPPILPMIPVALARGRMNAVAGRPHAARVDLEDVLKRIAAVRGLSPWGTLEAPLALAETRHRLGDRSGALALADEVLARARARGARRALGDALRVRGVALGGSRGVEQLTEAVRVLRSSPSLLARAGALVELGAAVRGAGDREAARDALGEGMDLAHRCGATALVDRAAAELRAAGARPRRPARTGADALTAAERRVVELAAVGRSNKEIAQTLFVTLRTVELHLSKAYGKLGITTRDGLAKALPG